MFSLQKRLTSFLFSYSGIKIVTECKYASAPNVFLDSKYLQKIINKSSGGKKSSKTKKKWHQSYAADPLEIYNVKEPKNKQGETRVESTRARQLGHVLYDRIVQIINTGELSEELLSKQVSITSVKMLPSFQGVHVYWDNNRTDAAEIESLLQAQARKLRSILISYHVLGRIPTITFVKDQLHTDLERLNQLFEVADYGPDYVPSCQNSIQRSHLMSQWGRSVEPQSPDPAAANMNKTTDAGFHSPKATQVLETEGSEACLVEKYAHSGGSDAVESSESSTQNASLMAGLRFLSNVYSLPHDDLMRKVIAQKGKHASDELINKAEAMVDFDTRQLKSKQDKMRLQYVAESSKFKQRLLDRDPEDLVREDDN